MKIIGRALTTLISFGAIVALIALVALFYVIQYYSADLPDYTQLAEYTPNVATRFHAADGQLIEEYATEKRIFVPIFAIPDKVKNAFIAAEDKNFYGHPGLDIYGITRAIVTNIKNYGSGRRPVGGSTITQQVAKNFLLTNEVSYKRKFKEAIIAFRIEKAFSKNEILELYLNEIYLGKGHYGVAASALGYFNKSLEDLEVHEVAYLAALPKAPNNYQVDRSPDAALYRRNWVLRRMFEDGYIDQDTYTASKEKELKLQPQRILETVDADYFNEEIRRFIIEKYGEDALYRGGLSVRTTLNPKYQKWAAQSLIRGLRDYDKRHGWRGPLQTFDSIDDWATKLSVIQKPEGAKDWDLAVVLSVSAEKVDIGVKTENSTDMKQGEITLDNLKWAREWKPRQFLGERITAADQVLNVGDVILVSPISKEKGNKAYELEQIPNVQGAIIVMDVHTGRVLAIQGGYDYNMSEFNRVTQAMRQPGSAFKPFVYLSAMNNGFTPSHLVLDAPFVMDQGQGKEQWKPSNYSGEYYGLTPVRVGLEKSRNLMTIRLADYIGMEKISDIGAEFGIFDNMPSYLSMSLGSGETTLYRLVNAYSMLVNGGKTITPSFIDRVQDRYGNTVFQHDQRGCERCGDFIAWEEQTVPSIPDKRSQITDPRLAFQITSMLEGVVQRGTGQSLKSLNHPIGGKTGTTNDFKDAWFIGFTPNLVVGTYVGFDEPRTLGRRETGSKVAAPIVKYFFEQSLNDVSPIPFRIPDGLNLVRINTKTGALAQPGDKNIILEPFIPGTEPHDNMLILDSQGLTNSPNIILTPKTAEPSFGTGGFY